MRSQTEMRNMLLDGGEKAILDKVAKNLAEVCSGSTVLWKLELASNEIVCLAEEISKQNIGGVAWFFLTTYSKMRGERNEEGIVKQSGTRTYRFGIISVCPYCKTEKAGSEDTKCMADLCD